MPARRPAATRLLARALALTSALILCTAVQPTAAAPQSTTSARVPAAQTEIPAAEYDALVALYNATGGAGWTDPWTFPTDHPCALSGVTCNYIVPGHVGQLILTDRHMVGTLPAALGNLTELRYLAIVVNPGLTGPIPGTLGNLTHLWELDLSRNHLTGAIPASLGNLDELTSLYLYYNQLTGQLPGALGNLSSVVRIVLTGNPLRSTIPAEFGNLATLRSLHMNGCELQGEVPAALTNLTVLGVDNPPHDHSVDLGGNHLWTPDPAVKAYLDAKDPDWAWTQSIDWIVCEPLGQLDGDLTDPRGGYLSLSSWGPVGFSCVEIVAVPAADPASTPPGMRFGRAAFTITANGNPAARLGGWPVQLELHYTDAQMAGLDEGMLALYRQGTGGWEPAEGGSTVVAATNTVTATIRDMGTYALLAPWTHQVLLPQAWR